MEKNESEKVIRETIEYANKEIQKSKRRSVYFVSAVLIAVLTLLLSYGILFHYEIPVAYREGLVNVVIPEDKGLDIHVELKNYKKANAVLVQTGDSSYDLYIGVMQTVATKMISDTYTSDNFLRVGNGILFDYQGEQLLGFIPNGHSDEIIQHVYYLNDLSEDVMAKSNQELIENTSKILIWERDL